MLVQVSAADVPVHDSPDRDLWERSWSVWRPGGQGKGVTQIDGINMIEFWWVILLAVVKQMEMSGIMVV